MAWDDTAFRNAFGQFADTTKYPYARLDALASLGYLQFLIDPWGTTQDYAVQLFVAHMLYMQGPTGASGAASGGSSGAVQSKSVDKVSVSYDVAAGTYEGAGWYNLSPYGVDLYRLIRIYGAGPRQIMGDSQVQPAYPGQYYIDS